jgi:hypothetical protein
VELNVEGPGSIAGEYWTCILATGIIDETDSALAIPHLFITLVHCVVPEFTTLLKFEVRGWHYWSVAALVSHVLAFSRASVEVGDCIDEHSDVSKTIAWPEFLVHHNGLTSLVQKAVAVHRHAIGFLASQ